MLMIEINAALEGRIEFPDSIDDHYILSIEDWTICPLLREVNKVNHELITCIETLKKWKHEVSEVEYLYIDNFIEKELRRRNIPTKLSFNEDFMLSFDAKHKPN